jgi:hypothetical protein
MKYRIRIALAFTVLTLMAFQSGRVYEHSLTREQLKLGQQVEQAAVMMAEWGL